MLLLPRRHLDGPPPHPTASGSPDVWSVLVTLAHLRTARLAAVVLSCAVGVVLTGGSSSASASSSTRPQAVAKTASAAKASPVRRTAATSTQTAARTTARKPAPAAPRTAAPAGRLRGLAAAVTVAASTTPLLTGPRAVQPGGVVTPPAAPVLGQLVVAHVPSAIPADCSSDASSALNAWLQGLPAAGVHVVLPAGACYRTERDVSLTGKQRYLVQGNGALLKRTQATPAELRYPRNNRHFSIVGSADVVVDGLRVQGLNVVSDVPKHPEFGRYVRDLEFEHAFAVRSSQRVQLQDLVADAPFGDGVYLHSDSSDITVLGGRISRNGRQGVGLLSSRVLVDGLSLQSSRRGGFDLEPDAQDMSDVEIRNSTIRSHLLAFPSAGFGDVDRVHLHHNTVEKSGVPFIVAARPGFSRDHWTITDNWVKAELGSPVAAVRLWNAKGTVFRNNVVPVVHTQSRLVFEVSDGSDVTADCNSFRKASTLVWSRDGSGSVSSTRHSFDLTPPDCLDIDAVGAPSGAKPAASSNDSYEGAVRLAPLVPGGRSAVHQVLNDTYTWEPYEVGVYNSKQRSAWFAYRTGAMPEKVVIRTTGQLRAIKVITGPSLWWQRPVAEHYNTHGSLTVTLPADTEYRIQADDACDCYLGPKGGPRSLWLERVS